MQRWLVNVTHVGKVDGGVHRGKQATMNARVMTGTVDMGAREQQVASNAGTKGFGPAVEKQVAVTSGIGCAVPSVSTARSYILVLNLSLKKLPSKSPK